MLRCAHELPADVLSRRYFEAHHRATELVLQAPALPAELVDGRDVGERTSRMLHRLSGVYLQYLLPGVLQLLNAHPSADLVVFRPDLPEVPSVGADGGGRPDRELAGAPGRGVVAATNEGTPIGPDAVRGAMV